MSHEERNGYVKWGVFWVIICSCFTFIAGSYIFTYAAGLKVADAVVCNDRIRQSEDKNIADTLQCKVDLVNKEVSNKLDKIIDGQEKTNVFLASLGKQVEVNTKRLDKLEATTYKNGR